MSLIEEALRRLGDPTIPTEQPSALSKPLSPPPTPRAGSAAPAHSWTAAPKPSRAPKPAVQAPLLLAAAAVVILVVTAAMLLGRGRQGRGVGSGVHDTAQEKTAPTQEVAATNPPAPEPAPPATATPASNTSPVDAQEESKAQDALKLDGIVEGADPHYALINGQVVAVGEQIGNFTLIAAAKSTATLRRADGAETTLRVGR